MDLFVLFVHSKNKSVKIGHNISGFIFKGVLPVFWILHFIALCFRVNGNVYTING